VKLKTLAALAALSLAAGSASAATFSLSDTLASGMSRTYVIDAAFPSNLEAGGTINYSWWFPVNAMGGPDNFTYAYLQAENSSFGVGCFTFGCLDPNTGSGGGEFRVYTSFQSNQVVVRFENRTKSFWNCDHLTAFSICAVQYDPAQVGISFNAYPAGDYSTYNEAVPEPATWAMMIAGFGLAGAALRRRPKTEVSL
jgi:hypothetical protein